MSANIYTLDTLSAIGDQISNVYNMDDLQADITAFTDSSYNQVVDEGVRGGFDGENPWGGCFDSENTYLDGVSQIQCSGNGRVWNENYLKPTDYLGTGDSLDEVMGNINNGRVSSITETSNINPQLSQDIILHSDNQSNAVKGIVEETALSTIFFSKENTSNIQDTIRYRVYQNTSKVISRQSENELFIIMRAILLQQANFKVSQTDLRDEILKLNEMVVDYAVGKVSTMVTQYEGYISDLQTLPTPMDRPSYTNDRDYTFDISNIIT